MLKLLWKIIKSKSLVFGVLLVFISCGKDEGQGRPAPVITVECTSTNCPTTSFVKTMWLKSGSSCTVTEMGGNNVYFYADGKFQSSECSGTICRKTVNVWLKKSDHTEAAKFPERKYQVCAFVDTDLNGTIESGAGDTLGSMSDVELSKEAKTVKVEVISTL